MSSIRNFYKGKCILITGATGFLGSVLVEKLLRSFPDVGKLYLLARAKNEGNLIERSKVYFTDPLFEKMINENPNYLEKVQWIESDLSKVQLGLSYEDLDVITDTVNLVFHVGASIKLVNDLHCMIRNNLQGTLELLKIAKQIKNLQCFVNVSTAFSYARKSCKHIEEILYSPPIDPYRLIDLAKILPEDTLNDITEHIILDWPNTYTYTKNAIEYICNDYVNDFPVCIIRPGNITSTYREPIPFWSNSKAGVMGAIIAIMKNVLKVGLFSTDVQSHAIPVDIVANGTLASAYEVVREKPSEIAIYNFTSNNNPVTYLNTIQYSFENTSSLIVNVSQTIFTIFHFLLHLVPAYLLDFWLLISGNKTKYRTIFNHINMFLKVTTYFRMNEFQIDNNKFEKLWDKFAPEERELLFFDIRNIDWKEYFRNVPGGITRYLFNNRLNNEI